MLTVSKVDSFPPIASCSMNKLEKKKLASMGNKFQVLIQPMNAAYIESRIHKHEVFPHKKAAKSINLRH